MTVSPPARPSRAEWPASRTSTAEWPTSTAGYRRALRPCSLHYLAPPTGSHESWGDMSHGATGSHASFEMIISKWPMIFRNGHFE